MSEETPTIYAALAAVMAEIGHVGKDSRNPQGGYNFRGIDAVVNAVNPALRKHKVIVVPFVTTYEYGEILVGKNRTPMGHARVVVTYTFYGPDGSSIDSSAPGEAFDSGDKATPKAMSVAFRTALLQALCLPTDEVDVDATNYQRAEDPGPYVNQETGEVRLIDRGQLIELKTLESKLGKGGKDETDQDRADRMGFYGWATGYPRAFNSARELTQSEAEQVIAELRKRVPPEQEFFGDKDE